MKKKSLKIVLEIGIVITILVFFVLINEQITEKKRSSYMPLFDSNKYAYQVESVNYIGEDLVINGWFFELKKVRNVERTIAEAEKYGILLYDLSSEIEKDIDGNDKPREGISLDVEYVIRSDVNKYFACEYDYSRSGFVARINKEKIDLNNGIYQIVVKTEADGEVGIPIRAYIIRGELYYVNLDEGPLPEVKNTDLELIIDEGVCVMAIPDSHIWVYQYNMALYWIAEEGFYFEKSGDTYLAYQIDTTQYNSKFKEYDTKGNYFVEFGDTFEKYEITQDISCGKYRVCKRNLPADFAVYMIRTGCYSNKEWIWQQSFRPYIDNMK